MTALAITPEPKYSVTYPYHTPPAGKGLEIFFPDNPSENYSSALRLPNSLMDRIPKELTEEDIRAAFKDNGVDVTHAKLEPKLKKGGFRVLHWVIQLRMNDGNVAAILNTMCALGVFLSGERSRIHTFRRAANDAHECFEVGYYHVARQ